MVKKNVAMWSGGKDSTAMILLMIEKGYTDFDVVFVDTGIEWPEMYDYIKKTKAVFEANGISVRIIRGPYTWDGVFHHINIKGKTKGSIKGFPYAIGSWCTDRLKAVPMRKVKKEYRNGTQYIGLAIDERSQKRQSRIQAYLEGNADMTNIEYPLVDFAVTEEGASAICAKWGLVNPLYSWFGRTGCWCCPKQPLAALFQIYNHEPAKWAQLRAWQDESPVPFRADMTVHEMEEKFRTNPAKYEKMLKKRGLQPKHL